MFLSVLYFCKGTHDGNCWRHRITIDYMTAEVPFHQCQKTIQKENKYSWTILMQHSLLNAELGRRMQWDTGTLQNYSLILHQLTKEFQLNHTFAGDVEHHCESKPQCFQEISLLHMWSINHSTTWKITILLTYNYFKIAVPSTQTVKHIW